MGTLAYGSPSTDVNFDDRTLAHLQIVISAKLRRREGFVFSWTSAPDAGTGRNAIWLDPTSTLMFRYQSKKAPPINREWINLLASSSNSPGGLVFTAEPSASHNQ